MDSQKFLGNYTMECKVSLGRNYSVGFLKGPQYYLMKCRVSMVGVSIMVWVGFLYTKVLKTVSG